ncbi:hypothetical protein Dsin_030523 [Dipteronia sinensis]|uniref:Ubiquitin-like protease family profile domain-containing protein n=1 Tax=Dipteronia sinensis TaxID=43782 RepID=A0AAD9ZJG7_9ROSI|nr:hypothetical protein Dsin_030523 [Dipteronia sinensis]
MRKENGDGSDSFRESMLNGAVRYNNKTLEAIFKVASSDNDEDMVKLALLYFLETVLFGKDQKVHIEAHHVELLENLETFNKYQYGRNCNETTLNSLQRDLRKLSQEYHTTSKKMIWACEAIPAVGVEIANKFDILLPQIVNWITSRTPDSTNGERLTPTKDQYISKEKMDDAMKVDGAKMDEKGCLDLTEELVHVVIYLPLNYESNHRILAEIDFIAQKITVYDFDKYYIRDRKKFINFMQQLSTLPLLVLHKIDFFSRRPDIDRGEDMTHWLVECCVLVPQQEKSDCGLFIIKFTKHLIHGESIDSVQADKAKYFIKQLCLIFWRSTITL